MSKNKLSSPEETYSYGIAIGKTLHPNSIVALFGDLGAGKTTLIKGIANGASNISPREVSSPTFTYLNIYTAAKTIYHFDLYRLKTKENFLEMGFDEYFDNGGICCIEWPENIACILPPRTKRIELSYLSDTTRAISLDEGFASISAL